MSVLAQKLLRVQRGGAKRPKIVIRVLIHAHACISNTHTRTYTVHNHHGRVR